MTDETKNLVSIVRRAARLITPEFSVKSKDEKGDLVTNFDYEIETFLIDKIKKAYPGFQIISEEFNAHAKECQNYFTIDPIDGTVNFANGLPLWGIQVACVKNGEPCCSVIFLPDLKQMYCADQEGAFLNGERIHVCVAAPENVLYNADQIFKSPKENIIHRREVFSSAVFFAWLASGRYGAVVFSKNTHVWDAVPGTYLAKQAGAYVLKTSGFSVAANSKKTAEYFRNLFLKE